MITKQTIQQAYRAGESLWSDLASVRSESCVTGIFAALSGDQPFGELREKARSAKSEGETIMTSFRNGCRGIYDSCGLWHHSLTKPFGYAGDFSILELVYDKAYHEDTASTTGRVLESWALDNVLPTAVRDRKDTLRMMIEKQCLKKNPTHTRPMRILSVGSGSARELRELPVECLDLLEVVMVDSDEKPLEFAKAALIARGIERAPTTITANFLKLKRAGVDIEKGGFDLVYSFGVIDYLPDTLATRLLTDAARFLKERGTLIFCVKDTNHYTPWFYSWFYDWRFVPRTIADGERLATLSGLTIRRTAVVENQAVAIFECVRRS
jgi:SAM-dependent methyltransferase